MVKTEKDEDNLTTGREWAVNGYRHGQQRQRYDISWLVFGLLALRDPLRKSRSFEIADRW
jgi:hypothetical protein